MLQRLRAVQLHTITGGRRTPFAAIALVIAALLVGCAPPPEAPPAGIQDLEPGWTSFSPGGDTTCSDGSPYRFFVRPGDPDKLMIFLQGGGACWSRETCDPQMKPSYNIRIREDYRPWPTGIFNFDNPDNPFADYSIVMVPYCTGDVHLGASDRVYDPVEAGQEPLTIHHQGRANVLAVLDWTYENVPAPEKVFVTGSSAGASPSPYYAAVVADHYPDANVAQLGDGAGGYGRGEEDTEADDRWGTFDFINQTPGFEGLTLGTSSYEDIYIAAAKAHPDIVFAEYDAAEDSVQKRFLALGGNETTSLLERIHANYADIRAEVGNFRGYIAGGDSHTILSRSEFYTYASDGRAIRDWVSDLEARATPDDVICANCDEVSYVGEPMPAAMKELWNTWQDPQQQLVKPFKIFDNVYYVGVKKVAAYVIDTGEGLILIDSLYGRWVRQLFRNFAALSLDPAEVKYVISTHGHLDHVGGARLFQHMYGARVVMAAEDWSLAEAEPDFAAFYVPVPTRDMVAEDGDVIELGDTRIELFKTPGHTEGVLSLRFQVRDGDLTHTAMTLGGVSLPHSGEERTLSYIESYRRLQAMQDGVEVSLPNHPEMAEVLERAERLKTRQTGDPHPFVDADAYRASLASAIAKAELKLEQE